MNDDDDQPHTLTELALKTSFKRRTLHTQYQKGKLELYLIAGALYGTKRQVKEMVEKMPRPKKEARLLWKKPERGRIAKLS
jgi:hypothetical protein